MVLHDLPYRTVYADGASVTSWPLLSPAAHRVKLYSNVPIKRLNVEIRRHTEVVGIFLDEPAIHRLVGAILLEKNDEWAVQRCRYIIPKSIVPIGDDLIVSLPALAV